MKCEKCQKFDMNRIISECRREINFDKQLSTEIKDAMCLSLIDEHCKMHDKKTAFGCHRNKLKQKSMRMLHKMMDCGSKRITKNDVKL